ncbi:hypothetical protein [Mucilaginibacter sp. PAMB04168]|uniref:hypothetical protein n=1 Tax=Mucilaginibacter sp. PAMB04168 TaxID=3138567 RepID=UPI0031F65097
MLFEEFFKKKKINLDALQQGDLGLFSEFKEHYEQMGEKSFDHTKKFWFNKLRRQYPLPPEVKTEKLRAENQIAEQTVSDTLTEPSPRNEAPKLGFKPKFKTTETSTAAPATPNPVENNTVDDMASVPSPKPAYVPRFQAKSATPKPAAEAEQANTTSTEAAAQPEAENNDIPVTENAVNPPVKPGFKPRFKAGVTTNKPANEQQPVTDAPEPPTPPTTEAGAATPSDAPAKVGFKPRFKAGVTTSKPVGEPSVPTEGEPEKTNSGEKQTEEQPTTTDTQPKPASLGFKPRFKAGVTTTKPADEPIVGQQPDDTSKAEPIAPEELPEAVPPKPIDTPKPAYKPRFNPKMIKPKPDEDTNE